jgi:hypothetical protein
MVLYRENEQIALCLDSQELGLPLVRLEIKHHHQPKDMYCVPTSMKMCLDFVCKKYKVRGLSVFSIKKIAKITRTTVIDGTPPRAVEKINEHLLRARPSISFVYREGSKFPEIDKELNKNCLPVIAYLNPKEKPQIERHYKLMHAVVLVEYDSLNHMVYYDDPEEDNEATAIQSLDVGTFNSLWEWERKWVQILLGEKQTNIQVFLEQEGVKK